MEKLFFVYYFTCFLIFLGPLVYTYGLWALNSNNKINGIIITFIGILSWIFITVGTERTSKNEITNFKSLHKEVFNNKANTQSVELRFGEVKIIITDPKEVETFKKDSSKFHVFANDSIKVFIPDHRYYLSYSIN